MYQEQIRAMYDRLSPGYRRIADYLVQQYREAAFLTASEIARAAGVDTTSVVRFAQRLGYPGFPELIADVQEEVKRDLRAVYQPAEGGTDPVLTFRRSLMEDRNNLDYILHHNDEAEVESVVELISAATRVYIVGEGASTHLADLLATRLASLGIAAWPTGGDMLSRLAMTVQVEAQDVVLGIAASPAAAGVSVTLRVARDAGVHTVAIAGSPVHRAAQVAEHVLYAPTLTGGVFFSPVSVAAVTHALLLAVATRRGEQTAKWAVRAEDFLRRYMQGMRSEPSVSMRDVFRGSLRPEDGDPE